jgi:hypothetical protein
MMRKIMWLGMLAIVACIVLLVATGCTNLNQGFPKEGKVTLHKDYTKPGAGTDANGNHTLWMCVKDKKGITWCDSVSEGVFSKWKVGDHYKK